MKADSLVYFFLALNAAAYIIGVLASSGTIMPINSGGAAPYDQAAVNNQFSLTNFSSSAITAGVVGAGIIGVIGLVSISAVVYVTTSTLGNATKTIDNQVFTGVFESLTVDGQDITIKLGNNTITFWQSQGFFGSGASDQVPFIKGNNYELTFAVHGTDSDHQYLTLQSVVEVP